MKQIVIRLFPNGEISAETKRIKGKACRKYIDDIERLTNAVVTDSEYTNEYLESEVSETENEVQEVKE